MTESPFSIKRWLSSRPPATSQMDPQRVKYPIQLDPQDHSQLNKYPNLGAALRTAAIKHDTLIFQVQTGTGKTTMMPMLAVDELVVDKRRRTDSIKVVFVEPTKLLCMEAYERQRKLLPENQADMVGFVHGPARSHRAELGQMTAQKPCSLISKKNVIIYMTPEVAEMKQALDGLYIDVFVMDEFHSRTLTTNNLLRAALGHVRAGRIKKLVLVSATLPNVDKLKNYVKEHTGHDPYHLILYRVQQPYAREMTFWGEERMLRLKRFDPRIFEYKSRNLMDEPVERSLSEVTPQKSVDRIRACIDACAYDMLEKGLVSDFLHPTLKRHTGGAIIVFVPAPEDMTRVRVELSDAKRMRTRLINAARTMEQRAVVMNNLSAFQRIKNVYIYMEITSLHKDEKAFTEYPDTLRIILASDLLTSGVTVPGAFYAVNTATTRLPAHNTPEGFFEIETHCCDGQMTEQRAGRVGRVGRSGWVIHTISRAALDEAMAADLSNSIVNAEFDLAAYYKYEGTVNAMLDSVSDMIRRSVQKEARVLGIPADVGHKLATILPKLPFRAALLVLYGRALGSLHHAAMLAAILSTKSSFIRGAQKKDDGHSFAFDSNENSRESDKYPFNNNYGMQSDHLTLIQQFIMRDPEHDHGRRQAFKVMSDNTKFNVMAEQEVLDMMEYIRSELVRSGILRSNEQLTDARFNGNAWTAPHRFAFRQSYTDDAFAEKVVQWMLPQSGALFVCIVASFGDHVVELKKLESSGFRQLCLPGDPENGPYITSEGRLHGGDCHYGVYMSGRTIKESGEREQRHVAPITFIKPTDMLLFGMPFGNWNYNPVDETTNVTTNTGGVNISLKQFNNEERNAMYTMKTLLRNILETFVNFDGAATRNLDRDLDAIKQRLIQLRKSINYDPEFYCALRPSLSS